MAGASSIARSVGLKESEVLSVFACIIDLCKDGQEVYIRDFGRFYCKEADARSFYTPQIKGNVVHLPKRLQLKFRVMPAAKRILNPHMYSEEDGEECEE